MSTCQKCHVQHDIAADHATGVPAPFGCRYCNGTDVRIVERVETLPEPGCWALGGSWPKVAARTAVFAICGGCGHTSRGK